MDVLTIAISVLALLLSGISLYFQFLYRPRRLRAITMPMSWDGRIRFGICNAGKESIYVTGLSVDYSVKCPNGMSKMYPVGNLLRAESIINPGSIVEFSYVPKDPPEEFLKDAPELTNVDGELERTVDIIVFIQFAFPDGKVFSNWFKSGSYALAGSSKSHQVAGVNLDLLHSALPVLREKA
jgi:hypothetical protein